MDTGDGSGGLSSGDLTGSTPPPPAPVLPSSDLSTPVLTAPPATAPSTMSLVTLPSPPTLPDIASSSATTTPSIHTLNNIHNLIPFKLDVQTGSYSKWRELWRCVLLMYSVDSHVNHYSDPLLQTPAWRHTDLTLLLLLYSTIADGLYEVIHGAGNTAHPVWSQLHEFFLANQPAQAVHLSAEFRALTQGDLRIAEYCGRLKALTDALADVDEPVTDRTLTLPLLRGLSRRYQVIATVIPMQTPFPSFNQARSRLLLEEITQDARDRSDGSTALAIGPGGGGGSGGSSGPSPSTGDRVKAPMERGNSSAGDRGRGHNGGRGRGRGRGHGYNGGRGPPALPPRGSTPWMGYFAPWGTPFPPPRAPWVPPNAAGVLGPRPGAAQHAYPALYAGPSAPPQPSWGQAALYSAMNQLSLQQPGNGTGDWIFDSGASSHVTGSSHQDPPHEAH
nr:uncharacterized protein LOC109785819 [Aegilops tauschii subsp. strangulata]